MTSLVEVRNCLLTATGQYSGKCTFPCWETRRDCQYRSDIYQLEAGTNTWSAEISIQTINSWVINIETVLTWTESVCSFVSIVRYESVLLPQMTSSLNQTCVFLPPVSSLWPCSPTTVNNGPADHRLLLSFTWRTARPNQFMCSSAIHRVSISIHWGRGGAG